ncbi:MAG: hypothetical protein A3J25_11870 [Pseudomonadales bacterium RIFCSPLOWO2_02_FULL_63_210]|nr:MAG: hypothetical protein A3J25_11870 [Pseudomonadales bacterium RIFCSPLOWO2_02_FULL_63_210]
MAQACSALLGVEHPGAILPRRLMAQVLRMTTRQDCQPMAVGVLTKVNQSHQGRARPSVRAGFAFARTLG